MNNITIPLLTAADIDCRVLTVSKTAKGDVGAVIALYKDARVDMRILDEVFGIFGWKRHHDVIKDNLFCTITIKDYDTGEWVPKQDVGVESNTEKEKGEASDSFKRAGTNVGIGRELYTAPFMWIKLNEGEYYAKGQTNGKDTFACSNFLKFHVQSIAYDDRIICQIVIADGKDDVRFKSGTVPTKQPEPKKPLIDDELVTRLYTVANKHGITPKQVMQAVLKDYGKTSIETLTEAEYAALITRLSKATSKQTPSTQPVQRTTTVALMDNTDFDTDLMYSNVDMP